MNTEKLDSAPRRGTSPIDETMREFAAALRDVISETPASAAHEDPEDVYIDLANRLMLRLSRRLLTVAPTHCVAAARIFDILTRWMHKTKCSYTTKINNGRFEFMASTPAGVQAFFGGSSIQDAYAQAATTIDFNGDSL